MKKMITIYILMLIGIINLSNSFFLIASHSLSLGIIYLNFGFLFITLAFLFKEIKKEKEQS